MKHTAASFALVLLIAALLSLSGMAANEIRYTKDWIDFTQGTGPVAPLDPDYPDKDLTDLDNIEFTGDDGALSLNALPVFLFAKSDGGPFPASLSGDRVYPLYQPERPFAQIADLRGSGGGWTLTVSASRFYRDGEPALNGAKLRLSGGTALSPNSDISPPQVNDYLIIPCAGQDKMPETVAQAAEDSGMGAWIIRWYPLDEQGHFAPDSPDHMAGIDLYIPPGEAAIAGEYTATLFWTLSDTPA